MDTVFNLNIVFRSLWKFSSDKKILFQYRQSPCIEIKKSLVNTQRDLDFFREAYIPGGDTGIICRGLVEKVTDLYFYEKRDKNNLKTDTEQLHHYYHF